MTRAFLLSLLVRQRLSLREGFASRYPHAWLVWEPGVWTAPEGPQEETRSSNGRVHGGARPPGDSLCFELPPALAPLTLGRAAGSSITINDATLSREHLRLHAEGTQWAVEVLVDHGTRLGGATLAKAERRALSSGTGLDLGGIRLTYYEPSGFIERLTKEWS